MKLYKRVLSGLLSAALLGSVLPAVPVAGETGDPWNENAAWPALTSVSVLQPGQSYFTYKEWTGEKNSTDIHGNPVRQADVVGVNRQDAHASETLPYDSVAAAVTGAADYDLEQSVYYQLLTGPDQAWDLTVYKSAAQAQEAGALNAFYKKGFATTPYTGSGMVESFATANYGCGWKTVTLPASWQTQGFDFPIYSNASLPWKSFGNDTADDKQLIPAAPLVTNPVGLYRKSFDVDPSWLKDGKKVYISFKGVESAMYLYVNGSEVGYTEDSFDAHDFDITPFLNADGKDNLLAVRVHRWCDGSWLEDQDFLRLGGIFRDVVLYATPAVHIRDYKVETDLDDNFVNADLKLRLNVSNMSDQTVDTFGVDVKLFDAQGNELFAADPLRADVPGIDSTGEGVVSLTRRVTAPHLWSDEDPYLYTLVISLYDKQSGKHFESIAQQLGFREITFTPTEVDENYNKITKKYEQMLLNGKPLVIKGVNRHDIDPLTGRYVSRELYETDLRMIKQYNFNALRTSHYPNDEYLYHLCDQYGILVMAEANMESNELQNDSDVMARQLEPAYLDRITANMQERKNRTSVIMWSLGNECGNTPETKMFQRSIQTTVRPLDATRPVNYEPLGGNGGVDIWTTMYPAVSFVIDRGANTDRMPYMPIEYNHAMGNACGYFKEYWDAFRRYDNLLGGYIWDWVDQGLATPLDKSAAYSVAADQSRNGFTGELTGDLKRDAVTGKQYLEGTLVIPSRQDADNKINEALSSDRSFTMEMVVRPRDPSSTDYQPLMKKGDSQVGLRTHNNAFDLVTYVTRDGSKGTWAEWHYNRPASWGNGDWQHLALTYDGKTHAAKLYLNGTLINSTSTPSVDGATIMQSTYDLAINYCTERGRPGQNDVAVARIYTRALNAQEIAAQRQAYLNNTAYTIPADSDDVLMWLDFASAKLRPSVDGSVWDYYGEQGNDNLAGQYLGYGGDWGDVINTGNFCANGLVSSDRTPQAELQEIQYVQQPLRFTAAQRQLAVRQIEIFNESQWLDTARYLFQWELQEDGVVIDRGDFTATIAPQATQTVSVPFVMPSKTKDDGEYFLNVTAVLAKDTDWAQAGQVVGWQQFAVAADIGQVPKIDTATLSSLTKSETADTLTLSGEDFTLTVNKKTGLIGTYTVKGQTVLTKGPAPNFWRATIDNDGYFPKEWETANQGMTLDEMTVTMGEDDTICVIDVTLNLPRAKNSKEHLTYTVYGSGAVGVRARLDVNPEMGELLKFGAELTLPAGYENVTWFGNGPEDTFIDRRQGGQIGLYSSTVSDSFFPYAKPQASGNHTDVRYIALEEPGNPVGLMVVGENPLEASALHFKTGDYAGKRHPYQMPSRDNYTILNVDQISRGVGQSSCGPSQLAQYQLPVNYDFDYAFTILPYDTAADDPMTLSKPWRVVESPADPAQPSGYETAEIARFGGMERTINGAAINGGSLYADWTRANDNRVADLTGYDPANLRLRVRFELHAPDESVPPATWFKSGYVKLRSEQRADPAVNNGDPEHNYGWDINASWNLQYGENAFDIPLADALQGRFGNDSRTMYGSNNRKGQIDWTRIDRMIFVISAPNYNGLRMNVTYAAVVDTAFEKTLARLTELTESPLTQGSYTDASYAAYTDALKRGADVLADKRATLEQAQNAAAYLENTQAELTADPAAVLTAALRLRVSEAAQMDSLAVTPDALQAFEEALAAAQGVLDHDGVTQDEVDAALAALEKAIAGLTTVCRPGDVDESGAVTAADALMALQAATGKITLTTIQKMAADVDGQNGVTAADALAILQFATGKITAF